MTAHLFIIHLPVSLILVALVLELIAVATGDLALRKRAGRFLLAGAVTALVAFATGEGARLAALGDAGVDLERLEIHQRWGSVGVWGLIGAALVRTLWSDRSGFRAWLNLLVLVAAAGLVVAMTVSGTLVRHGG